MSDSHGQGQEPAPQDGQAPRGSDATDAKAVQQTPAGPEPSEPKPQSPERYDADYVKALRKSEAEMRKRLGELEARVKADDEAKLSEVERLTKQLAEATAKATAAENDRRRALIESTLRVELGKQGAVNPAVALKLVDQSGLDLADDGTVSGADKAVEKLLKDEPYLKAGAAGTSAGPPSTPKSANGAVGDDERRRQAVSIRQLW